MATRCPLSLLFAASTLYSHCCCTHPGKCRGRRRQYRAHLRCRERAAHRKVAYTVGRRPRPPEPLGHNCFNEYVDAHSSHISPRLYDTASKTAAIRAEDLDSIRALLAGNASTSIANREGKTPVNIAQETGSETIVRSAAMRMLANRAATNVPHHAGTHGA